MKIVIPLKLSNWNDIINANRINKYVGASQKKKEMQELGKLENDNIKHITEITHKAVKDSEEFAEMEIL